MNKKRISFLELSHVFANQVKLPYSTACVWSYCLQNTKIAENYSLSMEDWFYYMDYNFSTSRIVDKIKDCDVIGVSYFVWNASASDQICKKIKQINPKCIIIYGGLGTPKHGRCEQFLYERPWIDFIVHNEGEIVFENLLLSLLDNSDLQKVKGITTRYWSTGLENKIKNVANMPSPYLDGLFDNLLSHSKHEYKYEALIEPVRGCPYTCTFCEIGDKFFTKLSKQLSQKIYDEIEWVSKNKIDYLHIVDNNYGMFPEHMELSEFLIEKRDRTGYPNALNISWAKNKKPFLFEIAKKLHDAKLSKGVTIALQSMNDETLSAINRSNLDSKNIKDIVENLKVSKIPAYIEMIFGLPMESYKSFKDGIYYLLDEIDYHNYIGIYIMTALPNTPFSDPQYIEKYKIKTVETSPAFFHHDYPTEKLLKDTTTIVIGSDKLSYDDYVKASTWKWMITSTHFLGWTRIISIEMKKKYGIKFRDFYEKMEKWILENKNSFLNDEYRKTEDLIRNAISRKIPWGRKIESVSKIYWEYEEATAINIAMNKDIFYQEIKQFLSDKFLLKDDMIIQKQYHKMKDPYVDYSGDLDKWAKECMWWGRRIERFFVGENL